MFRVLNGDQLIADFDNVKVAFDDDTGNTYELSVTINEDQDWANIDLLYPGGAVMALQSIYLGDIGEIA